MAHRTHFPVDASKSDVKLVYGSATGAGAADLTGHDDDLVSSSRSGAGTHNLVFRHKYPRKCFPDVSVVGATAGLQGRFTAWDPTAGTATLQLHVGGVATDAAVGETIHIKLEVRNTRAND